MCWLSQPVYNYPYPFNVVGSPTIKSITIFSQVHSYYKIHNYILPCSLYSPMFTLTIKFITIFSHVHSVVLNGCITPPILYLDALTYWQIRHLLTNYVMSFILHPEKCSFKFWYILLSPEYIANRELCASINISFFSSSIAGTHNRLWHNNPPLDDLEKPSVGFAVNWSKILVNLGSPFGESMIGCQRR